MCREVRHKTMPYLCRNKGCGKRFSLKTGTVMQSSKLGYRVWVIALYLLLTNLKSVSSMKLHRDLEVTQKSAWHLAHRLRKALTEGNTGLFSGPVECDETYIGGKRKNMPKSKRKELEGRGPVGKAAIVGAKDRATGKVVAQAVKDTGSESLQGFVGEHAAGNAKVYTDDAKAYKGMKFDHESVCHSVGEYVRGMAHTNGIESFWSMLKRGYHGTFHHFSEKHLQRYVDEFAGRHNVREHDTINQMEHVVASMVGKRLMYRDLIA